MKSKTLILTIGLLILIIQLFATPVYEANQAKDLISKQIKPVLVPHPTTAAPSRYWVNTECITQNMVADVWYNDQKLMFGYDDNHRINEMIRHYWDAGLRFWQPENKRTISYTATGQPGVVYEFSWSGMSWLPLGQINFTYNEGIIQSVVAVHYDPRTRTQYMEVDFGYNTTSGYLDYIIQDFNILGHVMTIKSIFTYDANGRPVEILMQMPDGVGGWYNISKTELQYHAQDQTNFQDYMNSMLMGYALEDYALPYNGTRIKVAQEIDWTYEDFWFQYEKIEYNYNDVLNLTQVSYSLYNDGFEWDLYARDAITFNHNNMLSEWMHCCIIDEVSYPESRQLLDYEDIMANDDETTVKPEMAISVYPNPFNSHATVTIDNPKAGNIKMEVYNAKGQKVTTLLNGKVNKGKITADWNGKDDNGKQLGTGVYYLKTITSQDTKTTKLLLKK